MSLTEPIRCRKQVRLFIAYYRSLGQIRNYVLATLCIHTALRISDILSISCDGVYDFENNRVRETFTITEKKTKKSKTIALNKSVITALEAYLPSAVPGSPLILNNQTGKAISRIQAYRIIRAAAETLNFSQRVSCHSLRKTFGYHAWKDGVSPAVIMEIYNHSSFAVTRRYLGVSQDDKNGVYLGMVF
ncbi:MAG: tyrosine-type recombinase/integrase [Defluviitaleaceae bacterium]|nr:tyrosine-type recombinase/integrase [Defluviitaleaceae bacterium]